MVNGFINLNKESGLTSQKAVLIVKHILKSKGAEFKKIGHLGTLDPDAVGVLPIAVGRATKCFEAFLKKQKTYYAEFLFGKITDTLDMSGVVTEENEKTVKFDEINAVLHKFIGKIEQIPPIYSANSINGVRAYKLARKGETPEMKPKAVEVFNIELLKELEKNVFSLRITCGSGTYIRSLARDIASELQTVGLMRYLKREKSGAFSIENSVTLQYIRENDLNNYIIPLSVEQCEMAEGRWGPNE
jgi:tRNA pseudouridine55 synthase